MHHLSQKLLFILGGTTLMDAKPPTSVMYGLISSWETMDSSELVRMYVWEFIAAESLSLLINALSSLIIFYLI